ncbi:integrase [Leptospirillum sp. Group II 'CF-1']|nr:IS3 family transposase [Leptospirillum sp. Group II 'CF-1']AKS23125.1 integrase [Leptospirillum sp. Group II 'CF-1']
MVDFDCPEFSLSTQSALLGVSRSGLYYQPVLPSAEEVLLRHRIDEIYTRWLFFGSRRIAAVLTREGLIVGRDRVQTAMREMGIEGIHPGPNLSKRALEHKIYPYLLRNLTAQYPHHIWGIDLTYIRLVRGWMYLVAIIDWHSRYVVSWALDQTLEMPFVLDCVDRAFETALPAIFNSDQGSHFTSDKYLERLLSRNIQISMDGKGRAIDNIFTERLWRSLKWEEVYLNEYDTPRQARDRIRAWFAFYNTKRPHQSLDYRTPWEVLTENRKY